MGHDRFMYFEERKPTPGEVERVLGNFFNGVGELKQDGRRWTVLLPGQPRAALQGIDGARPLPVRDDERWLEVFHDQEHAPPYIDVITREQDEFVSVLADGLVALLARFFKARIEDS
jgi:hypothetical protein